MADIDALHTLFDSFVNFGATRNPFESPMAKKSSTPQMDVDKVITPTEVDITFNKVKGKTERKINFVQFQDALKLIAAKKYPSKSPSEAYVHLVRVATQAGAPKAVSLVKTPSKGSVNDITARLTDPSKFTGTQKVTFEGRSSVPSTPSGKRSHSNIATVSSEGLGLSGVVI
ncbi:hypothetical protein HDU91_006611 [Kappamyces sp. JEL0680]|nr:hypothetical protein HDU91_006611 [Kappamyces sp. JEL0680]